LEEEEEELAQAAVERALPVQARQGALPEKPQPQRSAPAPSVRFASPLECMLATKRVSLAPPRAWFLRRSVVL
jgi:hypothetical protein